MALTFLSNSIHASWSMKPPKMPRAGVFMVDRIRKFLDGLLRAGRLPILVWFCFISAGNPAFADEPDTEHIGVAVAKDPDGNAGISANDIFGLIDGKLKSNFASTIVVFGGCYTASFTAAAKQSQTAKGGANLAVLAATDEKQVAECTPAPKTGNPFLQGIAENLQAPNTISQAFDHGVTRVQKFEEDEKNKNVKTGMKFDKTNPTPTYSGKGKDITLNGDPEKQYAILFVGSTETGYGDWNDVQQQFQALVDAGWKPSNINVYFSTGKGTAESPKLEGHDKTLKEEAEADNDHLSQTYTKGGQEFQISYSAASFNNLRDKLTNWAAFANLPQNKGKLKFYISFAGHTATTVKNRTDLLAQPATGKTEKKHPKKEVKKKGPAKHPTGTAARSNGEGSPRGARAIGTIIELGVGIGMSGIGRHGGGGEREHLRTHSIPRD